MTSLNGMSRFQICFHRLCSGTCCVRLGHQGAVWDFILRTRRREEDGRKCSGSRSNIGDVVFSADDLSSALRLDKTRFQKRVVVPPVDFARARPTHVFFMSYFETQLLWLGRVLCFFCLFFNSGIRCSVFLCGPKHAARVQSDTT